MQPTGIRNMYLKLSRMMPNNLIITERYLKLFQTRKRMNMIMIARLNAKLIKMSVLDKVNYPYPKMRID